LIVISLHKQQRGGEGGGKKKEEETQRLVGGEKSSAPRGARPFVRKKGNRITAFLVAREEKRGTSLPDPGMRKKRGGGGESTPPETLSTTG